MGYLIAAGAIGALAYYVDWAALAGAFGKAELAPLASAAIGVLACYLFFAWRWRTLLTDRGDLPYGPVFAALMTGYLANVLFPLRPGDFLRALLIDRQFGYGKVKALTSVGLERIFDLSALCLLGFFSLTLIPDSVLARMTNVLVATLALVATLVLGLTALVVLGGRLLQPRGSARTLIGKALALIGHLRVSLLELAGGASGFAPRVVRVCILSMLGWACVVAAMVACVYAFAPETTYGAALVMTVVTNLGTAIPGAPAGVGVYHGLVVMTLVTFGISTADALAIAIVSHGLTVGAQAGLGVGALLWSGTSGWRTLQEAREDAGGFGH